MQLDAGLLPHQSVPVSLNLHTQKPNNSIEKTRRVFFFFSEKCQSKIQVDVKNYRIQIYTLLTKGVQFTYQVFILDARMKNSKFFSKIKPRVAAIKNIVIGLS